LLFCESRAIIKARQTKARSGEFAPPRPSMQEKWALLHNSIFLLYPNSIIPDFLLFYKTGFRGCVCVKGGVGFHVLHRFLFVSRTRAKPSGAAIPPPEAGPLRTKHIIRRSSN